MEFESDVQAGHAMPSEYQVNHLVDIVEKGMGDARNPTRENARVEMDLVYKAVPHQDTTSITQLERVLMAFMRGTESTEPGSCRPPSYHLRVLMGYEI